MNKKWTKTPETNYPDRTPIPDRYTVKTAGPIGRRYMCGNAVEISAVFHTNGSGKGAFGGATHWPVAKLEVGFQEGQIAERDAFIEKLQKFLDETLPGFEKCADCGTTEDVTLGYCPYAEDIRNEKVPVALCPKCHKERCNDI